MRVIEDKQKYSTGFFFVFSRIFQWITRYGKKIKI